MCKDAWEIQKGKAPLNFDKHDFTYGCPYDCGYWHLHPFWWWLPRQDQLQKMMGGYKKNTERLHWYFYHLLGNEGGAHDNVLWVSWNYYDQFQSMEQLWLAFVMKEKFGKVWNNKEWVIG
jgi:hypothetical protein